MTAISILFVLVVGLIFLVGPNLLFWWTYRRKTGQSLNFVVLIGKGVVAGLAGWTWIFPVEAAIALTYPAGGVFILGGWLYGVWIMPFIGIAFTCLFGGLIYLSGVKPPILGRIILGACMSGILGIVLGSSIAARDPLQLNQIIIPILFILIPIGCASAIVVGEHRSDQDDRDLALYQVNGKPPRRLQKVHEAV